MHVSQVSHVSRSVSLLPDRPSPLLRRLLQQAAGGVCGVPHSAPGRIHRLGGRPPHKGGSVASKGRRLPGCRWCRAARRPPAAAVATAALLAAPLALVLCHARAAVARRACPGRHAPAQRQHAEAAPPRGRLQRQGGGREAMKQALRRQAGTRRGAAATQGARASTRAMPRHAAADGLASPSLQAHRRVAGAPLLGGVRQRRLH